MQCFRYFQGLRKVFFFFSPSNNCQKFPRTSGPHGRGSLGCEWSSRKTTIRWEGLAGPMCPPSLSSVSVETVILLGHSDLAGACGESEGLSV